MRRYGYIPNAPWFKVGQRVDGKGETDYRGGLVTDMTQRDDESWDYEVCWDVNGMFFWYRDWELNPEGRS